ncbi:PP2C family protein-serine/threonine phosphatase [Anaeromyxobacter terrae]|uniref:PP2C family protein-serine/threonine phosphatase n=1 Tax=Anaeromyxobacter terrae TaxID=2925406 RepID=UPI001F5A4E85|nr:SpoIIE family protein phosphatase [Anaeromyxobacter sp. SG22]
MFSRFTDRTKSSLRLRLLVATLVLVALALAIAAVAFERVARSVIVDAVHSHLSARAEEVQAAVVRFQRERALAIRNWAEAEAMQMTIDSGDPKFAEDYLRRTIQDQGGTISAAALLDMDGAVIAAVREGAAGERRGLPVVTLRGVVLGDAPVKAALEGSAELGDGVAAGTAPLSRLDPTEGGALGVMVAAPVKDFAGDLVGLVVGVLSPHGLSRLLGGIAGEDGLYQPIVADEGLTLVVSVPSADARKVRALAEAASAAPGALERVALAGTEPVLSVRTAPDAGVPGWRTLMAVHEADAYGRLYWLRAILGVLFLIVLAVAGVASIGAIRQASRPLTDITQSMTQVASGDLSTRVPETYRDELGHLVHSFNVMVSEVERSRDELQRTEALRREVEIAHRIQTAILPVAPSLAGYEVAARMKPADDVGGDLYDLLPFDDTFWVLVGDVSGHGINSGLVMMMAQAAAYAAIAENPGGSPKNVIAAVNRVVHENVRRRMQRDDYLTLMAARHLGDGRFVAAGAHQPIFLSRGSGKVDVIEPAGPWCGLGPSVKPREYEFEVHPGEMLCLITDGVVEAPDARGDLFGEDRLAQMLSEPSVSSASASQALAAIFSRVEAFAATQADDMTAVVLRRQHHA